MVASHTRIAHLLRSTYTLPRTTPSGDTVSLGHTELHMGASHTRIGHLARTLSGDT